MLRLVFIALGTYAALVAIMYFAQRHFTYFPDSTRYDPATVGLPDFAEVKIETADGLTLIAWYKAAAEGRPTILLFQGNTGNIANRNFKARAIADRGFGLLMLNYRGYGGSEGKPDETGLQADGRAALSYLVDAGSPLDQIVLYGESLGCGVAVALAETRKVAALVLEAPYTSLPDVASSAYPWLPVRFLMKDRFASIERIGQVNVPILVVHGSDDEVIPVALGRELFEAANEPKRLVIISGAHHNDIFNLGSGAAIFDFLNDLSLRIEG